MLTVFFSVAPFFISLVWCVYYILRWKSHNAAQHMLTIFAFVCALLYGFHALFFLGEQSELLECIWMICSLAIYPLYYFYILRLTSTKSRMPSAELALLLPALILPVVEFFCPIVNDLYLRQIAMAVIVAYVCTAGLIRLNRFERDIHEYYADTDDKSSYSIRALLIFFTICSVCTVVFSSIGRDVFLQSTLLLVPSVLFSVLLFAVFYLGAQYTFTSQEMGRDCEEPQVEKVAEDNTMRWVPELERLMREEKIYLEPNLKIADLALRVGTCRTYISNYINQQKGVSFSDYINEQRIRHAEQLLKDNPNLTVDYLATVTGFSSEQSFVRNFRKFSTKPLHK